MAKCIVVLTRGYDKVENYETLIRRNKHISNNLRDKSLDILLFHEGNIKEEHQTIIKKETPDINMRFINISNIAFKNEKQNIEFETATQFGLGYRHMCSFWFVNFFNAVTEYDKILRIDEDCFIYSNIDNIFLQLDEYVFVCGSVSGDCEDVTQGLNKFSLDFLKEHENEFVFKKNNAKDPLGPYTNLIGFSLDKIRNNDVFQKYRNSIDKSDMIYKRRWGDLPLWGEVIYYIFGNDSLKIDNTIKYFHGSHCVYIN
jgi:hypothetical protein